MEKTCLERASVMPYMISIEKCTDLDGTHQHPWNLRYAIPDTPTYAEATLDEVTRVAVSAFRSKCPLSHSERVA